MTNYYNEIGLFRCFCLPCYLDLFWTYNHKIQETRKQESENKYSWTKFDIKKQERIKLEDIPEEPKKERTAAERQEEIDNIKAAMLRNRYWDDNYNAIDNLSPKDKAYYKPKVKPYGRFRSYLMDHKGKIILYLLSFFFLGVTISLLIASSLTSSDLGMPTWLLTFIGMTSLLAGFGLFFFAVESN